MNWFHLPLTFLCILIVSTVGWGQVQIKLDQVPGTELWGVYLKVCEDFTPTGNTITGSGQITLKHHEMQTVEGLTSVSGTWQKNAAVISPDEAPGISYTSIGFVVDNPQIIYQSDEETLLFTFTLDGGVGTPSLIDNETDPFNQLPNSESSNPGNDLTAIDMGVSPIEFYNYSGNFTGTTPKCNGVPVDTTATTNPDSTGGGTTTPTFEEIAVGGHFTLSPNPTHEWLNVEFKDGFVVEEGVVRFWSVTGVPLGEMVKAQQEKMTLNVGNLPDGLYLLSFEVDGKVIQRERFLKQ